MRELTCYYHPNRKADEKCEACEKLLCLECKKVYTSSYRRRRAGARHNDHSLSAYRTYYTSHDLCPECYYDRQIAASNPIGCYLMMGVATTSLIIMTIISSVMINLMTSYGSFGFDPFNAIFLIFPILMIIGVLVIGFYMARVRAPRIKEEAISKKSEFLRSVGLEPEEPEGIFYNNNTSRNNVLTCPNCGQEIEGDDKFCENCGKKIK